MRRIFSFMCLFISVLSSFALTITDGKIYAISNRNDNNIYVKDNGNEVIAMGEKDNNSLWQFIPTGKANCYYVKNVATGRYAQLCANTTEVSVTMGDTPAEYIIIDCSTNEGTDCFGFTTTNLDNTNFAAGCIGWNWRNDNTVQTFTAVAGTNHRSFWKLTEENYSGDVDITYLIKNNDFELTDGMIEDGANFRGVPTSWKVWGIRNEVEYTQEPGVNQTTLLPAKSYGANGGCSSTRHADKSYWLNCTPMPDDMKLYQSIHLEAGMYRISCLLSPMGDGDENYTNLRLFAGDNACYFGIENKYDKNLGNETAKTFMGNITAMDGSDPKMQPMILEFTLDEAADIEIGIRTSNMLKNGNRATSNQGRFRTDYFQIVKFTEKHVHDYSHNGICTCEGNARFEEPALVDGYYEIKNAGNLEWFSNKVDAGGDANLQINGKLMNDIDMLGIVNLHKPIGQTTGKKYNGTFDGQGFRIKNMIIERPNDSNIGFFGFLRGNAQNTTVRNLIMDKSCTIHGYNRVGGITGSCQNSSEFTITLENIINEATVIAEHQDAAGIIGGQQDGGPKWLIRNVLNLGTITAKNEAPYAGALCCYLGGNNESVIENFVNLGTINGHRGGNIGRIAGKYTNIIDLSNTDFESSLEANYGLETGLTQDDITNGKLAYTLGWGQFLGSDSYPTPMSELSLVSYVGNAGYATLYDTTTGYVLNGDVEVYVAVPNNTWLDLTKIENVPAGTPVILKGTYYNKLAQDLSAINIANALKGTDTATEADGTMYVLAKVDDMVGFYKATGTIPAGKAYYQSTSNVKAFYFAEDGETAIANVNVNDNQTVIYNIAGQRISKLQKGINIVNGKKVLK